jgi:hypothetical protein
MAVSDPFLTIFTAPKAFTDPHIDLIQRNAIQSWQHLAGDVNVMMIGDEPGMLDFSTGAGILQLPQVKRNSSGTPLVSSIFELARQNCTSPLLAYVNADILITPALIDLARLVYRQASNFLIVGQRWDLDIQQALEFSPGWDTRLLADVNARGRVHLPAGSDFFIFPRTCFNDLPDFAIGRAGWDNWMFYHGRQQRFPVVDISSSYLVIHQDHDYSHLPDGKPHYHMPESFENIRLAGGRRTIFHLEDADYFIKNGRLEAIPLRGRKLLREIEIYPLIRFRSKLLAELLFILFHPINAWKEWSGRVGYKLDQLRGAYE